MPPVHSGGTIVQASVPYVPTWDVNVVQSLFYHLSGTIYSRQVGGSSGSLVFHHPQLSMAMAYPRNLPRITLPHLAIEQLAASTEEPITMGISIRSRSKVFSIWGFAGSYDDPDKNAWEQTQLLGDIRGLCAGAPRFPIYDFSSGTASLSLMQYGEIRLLSADILPPNTSMVVDSFKFQVNVQVEY